MVWNENLERFGMTNLKFVYSLLASHYNMSDAKSPKKVKEQSYMDVFHIKKLFVL